MNRFRVSTLLIAAAALAASGVMTLADQVVYFVNGKAITVKKVEKGDSLTILEIEGGGRIGIPTAQIERIEELTVSAAAAPQVAAPAVLPPPPQQTQALNQAPPPPAAPQPAGPGTGGHVAANAPANTAQPLGLGGNPSEEAAAPRPRAGVKSSQPGEGAAPAMTPGQSQRGNMMLGGPGGRNGRQGGKYGKNGRLPSGAYLPPGAAAGQPRQSRQAGAQAGQPGQTGAQQPSGTSPAPPPTNTPPPPPPDPAENDPGSSDGAVDDGSTPDAGNDTPASDDGDSGQS